MVVKSLLHYTQMARSLIPREEGKKPRWADGSLVTALIEIHH